MPIYTKIFGVQGQETVGAEKGWIAWDNMTLEGLPQGSGSSVAKLPFKVTVSGGLDTLDTVTSALLHATTSKKLVRSVQVVAQRIQYPQKRIIVIPDAEPGGGKTEVILGPQKFVLDMDLILHHVAVNQIGKRLDFLQLSFEADAKSVDFRFPLRGSHQQVADYLRAPRLLKILHGFPEKENNDWR